MAGTLFSLAMSQWRDVNGLPEQDAPLYIYEANSSTPVDVYQDFGLSVLHPWPMRTNSYGMIPPFWLDDGAYRARMTNAAGSVVYFDVFTMQAVGPSDGSGEGGGGGGVDQNAIFQTGDPIWLPRAGARSGWVRMNGRTIGSATSGATERANADTQPLFEYLWNNFDDTLCPVTGGRGANAASDFAANKPIGILDMRGRGPFGLDDMGNNAAGIITDGTPTAAASGGGSEKFSFNLARNQLPNVSPTITIIDPGHSHSYTTRGGTVQSGPNAGGVWQSTSSADTGSSTTGITATCQSLNGGVTQQPIARNTMSPYRLGSWYMRL